MVSGAFYGVLNPQGGPASASSGGGIPDGPGPRPRPDTPVDGSSGSCDTILSFDFFGLFGFDIPEPGWSWVDSSDRYRSVSGTVVKSRITETDFPAGHDSHDQNTDITVDPGQDGILSDVGKDEDGDGVPDTIEVEWEIGTLPSETGSDPERTFPKWVWPNEGDRVWVNGNWIFDCGHPTDVGGVNHYRTEIHPPRAFASMRDQVRTMPGTGTTPVRVTATDLYVHGRSGMVMDILNCGWDVIVNPVTYAACITDYPHRGTPIDADYTLAIQLPPKPFPSAVPISLVETGPGNTVAVAPTLAPYPAGNPTQFNVTVPLAGTGATPDDVYARRIYVGWIYPPQELRHLSLSLNKMDLHEDMDLDPGDCECTFFWFNVNRAPNEWIRMSTYATGNMNDYDDDGGLGDGEMGFSGATFDFYVADGQDFTVRAHGYDQDCLDGLFGDHLLTNPLTIAGYAGCLLAVDNFLDNDDYNQLAATFGPSDYGVGGQDVTAGGQYELEFTINDIPVTAEDTADLRATKVCKPDGAATAGSTITCNVIIDNFGPALPRNVTVEDTLFTNVDPSAYTLGTPTFRFAGVAAGPFPCSVTEPGRSFQCALGTVPINGRAIITVTITADEGGDFDNVATVFSNSTDPDHSNNQAVDEVGNLPVSDLSLGIADSVNPVLAGDPLTYAVTVTNAGPSTATNVLVTDILPAEVAITTVTATGGGSCVAGTPGDAADPTRCAFGTLAVGSSETMTIVVRVDASARSQLLDDASAASDALDLDNSNNLAREITLVDAAADLSVAQTDAPDPVMAGTEITYVVAVTNLGPSTAADASVRVHLPSEVGFLGVTVAGAGATCVLFDPPLNDVVCQLGDVAPNVGSPVRAYVAGRVRADAAEGAVLNSGATVSTSTMDVVPGNDVDAVTTLVHAVADLEIGVAASCDICDPSARIVYTVTVTNHGPSDAQDVVVVDALPLSPSTAGVTYVFDTGGCSVDTTTNVLTCGLGTVARGSTIAFRIYITTTRNLGVITDHATVSTTTTDPDLTNNAAQVSVKVP